MSPIPPDARGYDGVGGVVVRTSADSTPWWPPETQAHSPNEITVPERVARAVTAAAEADAD